MFAPWKFPENWENIFFFWGGMILKIFSPGLNRFFFYVACVCIVHEINHTFFRSVGNA